MIAMTRGLHIALSKEDERRLLACPELERPELVGDDFEESYPPEMTCETDKAWDAMHRAFNASLLTYDFDNSLQGVILGGAPLYAKGDYIISYKTAEDVKKIS